MKRSRWAFLAALLLSLPAAVGAADQPSADLSVGYGFNRITNGGGLNMPVGLAVSLGGYVNRAFAVVGDVRWNRKSESGVAFNLTSFQAGPRLVFHGEGAKFYVQGLAGATRASGEGSSETKFSVMPGIGVDFRLSDSVGLRIGGDFRLIFLEGEDEKDLLAHADLVFRLGSR